jgi:hypothetical protein
LVEQVGVDGGVGPGRADHHQRLVGIGRRDALVGLKTQTKFGIDQVDSAGFDPPDKRHLHQDQQEQSATDRIAGPAGRLLFPRGRLGGLSRREHGTGRLGFRTESK